MTEELVDGQGDERHEPPAVLDARIRRQCRERAEEFAAVVVEQFLVALPDFDVAVLEDPRQGLLLGDVDLYADELGPDVSVVLVEPVGVGEPRRVLVRMRRDRRQQCVLVRHEGIVRRVARLTAVGSWRKSDWTRTRPGAAASLPGRRRCRRARRPTTPP